MRSERHVKNQKRKTWIKRIILILGILISFAVGTAAGYYGNLIQNFLTEISEEGTEEPEETTEQDETIADLHPISILLLGLDDDGGGPQRSDTMMVATINPEQESVKLVSIPRDTLITLPGTERLEKFNAVYPIYGIEGLKDFVEDYLRIPIHFHATLSFQGLVDLVDAVGGITVDSELSFTVQDSEENMDAIEIEEGIQTLDGEKALGYARMRKQDPRGDFGRQERQREVIQALANEVLSLRSLANIAPILNAISPNLSTNMSSQQIMSVASNYSSAAQNIESMEMSGVADYVYIPTYNQELYVWLPYEETLSTIQETLREHMELDPLTNGDDTLYETIEGGPNEEDEDDIEYE